MKSEKRSVWMKKREHGFFRYIARDYIRISVGLGFGFFVLDFMEDLATRDGAFKGFAAIAIRFLIVMGVGIGVGFIMGLASWLYNEHRYM